MGVKFGARLRIEPVKIVKEVDLRRVLALTLPRLPPQILDQRLGVNFLLNIDRRRGNEQRLAILLILAAPDELRIEIGIARIAQNLHRLVVVRHKALIFRSRDVDALRRVVTIALDAGFGGGWRSM